MTSRSTDNSCSAALSATPTTSSGSEDLTPAFSSAASPLADLGSSQMASSGPSQELGAAIQAAATKAALPGVRASLVSASASAAQSSTSSVNCVPSSVAQDRLHATAKGFLSSGSSLPALTADNQGMSTPCFLSTFSLPSTPVHVREGCNTNDYIGVSYTRHHFAICERVRSQRIVRWTFCCGAWFFADSSQTGESNPGR